MASAVASDAVTGVWAHSGTRLRCTRGEADGLGGIRGPPEARWCHGFEQRGSGQESYAAMADGGAHVDPVEVDGELGEGRTATNLTTAILGGRGGERRG